MRLTPLEVAGAFRVELDVATDERGSFTRVFGAREVRDAGLDAAIEVVGVSSNPAVGTLRGLHYQLPPFAEAKFIRCDRGALYDVLVDVRDGAPDDRRWCAVELDEASPALVYAPPGVAHGFLTLAPDTEVSYLLTAPYSPSHARGLRWDDPGLDIPWPRPVAMISHRDASYPDHPW